MTALSPEPDDLTPDAVAAQAFPFARRGYEVREVQEFLRRVAEELRVLRQHAANQQQELEDTRAELARASELDEDRLSQTLGEETVRVLDAARAAAADIRARGEREAEELLTLARERAEEIRAEAHRERATRLAEADAEAAARRSEAQETLEQARAEATARHEQAEREREEVLAEARDAGREMVAEARAVRERILRDLGLRRRTLRAHLEQLHAGRERLLEAYEVVRTTARDAMAELEVAVPEARAAAHAASARVGDDLDPDAAELQDVDPSVLAEIERAVTAPSTEVGVDTAAVDAPGVETPEAAQPPAPGGIPGLPAPPADAPTTEGDLPTGDDGDAGVHGAGAVVDDDTAGAGSDGAAGGPAGERADLAAVADPAADSPGAVGEADDADATDDSAGAVDDADATEDPDDADDDDTGDRGVGRKRGVLGDRRRAWRAAEELEGDRMRRAPDPVEHQGRFSTAVRVIPHDDEHDEQHDGTEGGASAETGGPSAEAGEDAGSAADPTSLFARLRAEATAPPEMPDAPVTPDAPDASEMPDAPVTPDAPEPPVGEADPATETETGTGSATLLDELLEARERAVGELRQNLSRRLKRTLADEQNEVLDVVRRHRGRLDVDDVLVAEDVHRDRYADAVLPTLAAVASAGADVARAHAGAAATGAGTSRVGDLAAELAGQVVDPLRSQIAAAVAEHVDDREAAVDAVRLLYRDLKQRGLDGPVGESAAVAFSRGVSSAVAEGVPLVVLAPDPAGRPADCEAGDAAAAPDGTTSAATERVPAGDPGADSPPPPCGGACRCLRWPEPTRAHRAHQRP